MNATSCINLGILVCAGILTICEAETYKEEGGLLVEVLSILGAVGPFQVEGAASLGVGASRAGEAQEVLDPNLKVWTIML